MRPWEFALVTLGAFRLWRIAACDSITEKAREVITGFDDDHAPALKDAVDDWFAEPPPPPRGPGDPPGGWKVGVYLSALIRCPWCLGFYVAVGVYVAWRLWPHATLIAMTPLAISAAIGIIRKNLDQDE